MPPRCGCDEQMFGAQQQVPLGGKATNERKKSRKRARRQGLRIAAGPFRRGRPVGVKASTVPALTCSGAWIEGHESRKVGDNRREKMIRKIIAAIAVARLSGYALGYPVKLHDHTEP